MGQFNAAPSALGYGYQCELALLEFLRRDDPVLGLSIEVLDDVALEGEQTELIQTKFQVTPGSLTDGSADLWKTLRVWSEGATTEPEALLILITTAVAGAGSIAGLLRTDGNRDPAAAHERLVSYARSTTTKSLQLARDAFLSLDNDARMVLVERIVISDGAPGFEDLDGEFRRALRIAAPPDRRDALATRLREWWLFRAEQHLVEVVQGGHPRVSGAEIEERLGELRDELSADNLPIDFEDVDPPEDGNVDEQRKFVMQLRLISLAHPRVRRAVHDHNRAFHQRSRWLREDLVGFEELRRYETRLREEWERVWLPESEEELEQISDADAEARGRQIFLACERSPIEPIRPKVSAPHIMRGSLHMLADEMEIGWHHDWVERMQVVLGESTP